MILGRAGALVLRGEPGVRSKRWSGRADLTGRELDAANNAKLVAALKALGSAMVDAPARPIIRWHSASF